jgi:hypothetical protein
MYAPLEDGKSPGSIFQILFGWLVFSQIIVLVSIYAWVEFRFYNNVIAYIPGLTSQHDPYILLLCTYPIFPLICSALAWLGMFMHRFVLTIFCSLLAVVPAIFLLLWIIVARII